MSVPEVLHTMLDRLRESASVKAVYGEPIEAQGKTIIPIAKVGYGFGGGSGQGTREKDAPPDAEKVGEGMGMGGGVGAKPLGVLEVTPQTTRFIPFGGRGRLLGALAAGLLVGLWLGRRR
jgi:uncharacterized spore protein YtfJ